MNTPQSTLHAGDHPRTIENHNDLVDHIPWINGVKTGYTLDAGYVLVGVGDAEGDDPALGRDGRPKHPRPRRDTLRLLQLRVLALPHEAARAAGRAARTTRSSTTAATRPPLVAQRALRAHRAPGPACRRPSQRPGTDQRRRSSRVRRSDASRSASPARSAAPPAGGGRAVERRPRSRPSRPRKSFALLGLAAIVIPVGLLLTVEGAVEAPEMATALPRRRRQAPQQWP